MTTHVHGFKKIDVGEYGAKTTRLACLQKLAIVLKKLRVENVPIFSNETRKRSKPFIRSLDDDWLEVFKIMFKGTKESFDRSKALF
jgi:hypothetical protein